MTNFYLLVRDPGGMDRLPLTGLYLFAGEETGQTGLMFGRLHPEAAERFVVTPLGELGVRVVRDPVFERPESWGPFPEMSTHEQLQMRVAELELLVLKLGDRILGLKEIVAANAEREPDGLRPEETVRQVPLPNGLQEGVAG